MANWKSSGALLTENRKRVSESFRVESLLDFYRNNKQRLARVMLTDGFELMHSAAALVGPFQYKGRIMKQLHSVKGTPE